MIQSTLKMKQTSINQYIQNQYHKVYCAVLFERYYLHVYTNNISYFSQSTQYDTDFELYDCKKCEEVW